MSKRRVGGSGWAGLYGSFIGIGKGARRRAGIRLGAAKKKTNEGAGKAVANSASQLEAALESTDPEVVKAARRVRAVLADIEQAKARLNDLEVQLHHVHNALAELTSAKSPTPSFKASQRKQRRGTK